MEAYRRYFAGKTVLVTGGAGAIGSNLSREISQLGADLVVVLDDLSSGFEWNVPACANVLFVKGSITDEVALKHCFSFRPDVVFHLAAFFANQNSVDRPQRDLEVNGLGTLLVFQYAQMSQAKRVVYASSGCSMYAGTPIPFREDRVSLALTTPYQITKLLGELYSGYFHHQYGMPVVKARLFNAYGPGEVPGEYRNVIPNFVFRALRGLPLPITGTGDETRDFTYMSDLVDGLLRAAYSDKAIGQEINIASAREIKIGWLANRINDITRNGAGTIHVKRRGWDNKRRLLANIDRAGELLGYAPRVSFEDGLDATITWFRENWASIERDAQFSQGMMAAVPGVASGVTL